MIHLVRTNEPAILLRKKAEWLASFIASAKARPDSSKYAHADIRRELNTISHNKCFYCERKLSGGSREVDHYIEVVCDKTKAFDWDNLYLSCTNCNNKLPDNIFPVGDALNPFTNNDAEIEQHISFDNEIIRIKNNSLLGQATIKKFRLDDDTLDYLRSKFLNKFWEELADIHKLCQEELRNISDDEKEKILRYSYPDHPFSLMFKILLRKRGLL